MNSQYLATKQKSSFCHSLRPASQPSSHHCYELMNSSCPVCHFLLLLILCRFISSAAPHVKYFSWINGSPTPSLSLPDQQEEEMSPLSIFCGRINHGEWRPAALLHVDQMDWRGSFHPLLLPSILSFSFNKCDSGFLSPWPVSFVH